METLFLILGLIWSQVAFGQIVYSPVFIDPCTEEPAKSRVFWMIVDATKYNGGNYVGRPGPTITLPKTGNYILDCRAVSEAPINISISTQETVRDTFNLSQLQSIVWIKPSKSIGNTPNIPPKYFVCSPDNLANGKVMDYYRNGKLREEGTFQNGILIDTLRVYYRTGELYKLVTPNGDGYKGVRYTIDGKVIDIAPSLKRIF
ncbi:hypothetical protein KZP23_13625 [Echinicola marina]|uniref:hypothetical protein n=1 Tax=Echinicola marina TaxID=2859768 RepID=UPI001CF69EF0|nr:hypothetical protein [Echinicola marina]UCS91777.1 hypothetical protein KZP23_13625 [Echinicola marina]